MQNSREESTSNQMTAAEREKVFQGGKTALNPYLEQGQAVSANTAYTDPGAYIEPTAFNNAQYSGAGQYQQAAPTQTLSGGDYDALESSILQSRLSPIQQQIAQRSKDINQSMADRGLYASGLPDQQMNKEMTSTFMPAINQAAAEASNQRYGLQSGENQMVNQANQMNAAGANAFRQANASAQNAFTLNRAGGIDQSTQGANAFNQARAQGANAFGLTNTAANVANAWRPADYMQGVYNQSGGANSSSVKASAPPPVGGIVKNELGSWGGNWGKNWSPF